MGVHEGIKHPSGDKAPALECFEFSFIKVGWDFLKEDVMEMILNFL